MAIHVGQNGQWLGCPVRLSSQLGHADALPRITVRVGKSGARKDRVFVAWPDLMDGETGQIVVWDMGTGEHTVDDQAQLQRNTRRADRDRERDVQEEIEYQIGGKVRVIAGNWGRTA